MGSVAGALPPGERRVILSRHFAPRWARPRGSRGRTRFRCPVRVILTLIAVALVTLLTAALIVPYFVDWSAHRDEIAERLEGVTGGRVTLNGPVTLRLLPTPYLEVGAGSAAGAGADAPRLAFDGARLELALVKLASGAFRFTDVRLDEAGPDAQPASADGALVLPAAGFDRAPTRSGPIGSRSGTGRSGSPAREAGPVGRSRASNSTATRRRLPGPTMSTAGRPGRAALRSSSASRRKRRDRAARRSGSRSRPGRSGPLWNSTARSQAPGRTGPALLGAAVITGTAQGVDGPTPWRAAGKLAADLDGATLTGAEFRFGPEERALRAEGSASLAMRGGDTRSPSTPRPERPMSTRCSAATARTPSPPSRAAAALSAVLAPALDGARTARVEARVAVETAILGGDTISGLSAALKAEPGAPPTARFELGLPGESRIKAEGEVETGAAARFVGAIDFSTGNPGGLGRWASEGAPELAAFAQALEEAVPASRFAVSGQVEAAAVGVSGKEPADRARALRPDRGARRHPAGRRRPRPDLRRPRRRFARPRCAAELPGGAVADRRLRPVPVARGQGAQPRPCRRGRDRRRLAGPEGRQDRPEPHARPPRHRRPRRRRARGDRRGRAERGDGGRTPRRGRNSPISSRSSPASRPDPGPGRSSSGRPSCRPRRSPSRRVAARRRRARRPSRR